MSPCCVSPRSRLERAIPRSYIDVVKGIDMFNELKVPTLSVVENMSYFDGDDGKRYFPFGTTGSGTKALCGREKRVEEDNASPVTARAGRSHTDELLRRYGIRHSVVLPIDPRLSAAGEDGRCVERGERRGNGRRRKRGGPRERTEGKNWRSTLGKRRPVVLGDTTSTVATAYRTLAEHLVRELYQRDFQSRAPPSTTVSWDRQRRAVVVRTFSSTGAREDLLPPTLVRQRSQSADVKDTDRVKEDVEPVSITTEGNYGVLITWSDGHDTSIYSFEQLRAIAKELGTKA